MNKLDISYMSESELCAKETFIDIYDRDDNFEIAELLGECEKRAKALGFVTKWKSLSSAFKKNMGKNMASGSSSEYEYSGKKYSLGSWFIRGGSVFQLGEKGNVYACQHPILPVERLRNVETKTEKLKIAFKRDTAWEEVTVPKESVASATQIVKLAKYGISVTSETAKYLVRYLADIETLNDVSLQRSTSRFGWIDKLFIPFDTDVLFDSAEAFGGLFESLTNSGSPNLWLEEMRRVRARASAGHYEPILMMAASFASVMIKPLNMLPFIVNVWGLTGKGKTVSAMCATSIWADPGENRYMTDALSTQNAFEIRLDTLNNLPLVIDDFSKVKKNMENDFTDLIYLLCSGRGKDRSNVDLGLNRVRTWSNITITNMESPLTHSEMSGGALNRVLDFETEEGDIFENPNRTVETMKTNYGFAGRAFIQALKEIGSGGIQERRRQAESEVVKECRAQHKDVPAKQILALSVLIAADRLAEEVIFKDGIKLDVFKCVKQLKSTEEINDSVRAYEFILDFTERNKTKFDETSDNKGEVWGFYKDGYVNINPTVMKNIAKEGNFSVKAFTSWAQSNGILKSNNKKLQNVIKANGTSKRYYSLALPSDLDTDDDGFIAVTQEEIPF